MALVADEEGIPGTALRGLDVTEGQIRADFMAEVGRCERPAAGPLDPGALASIGIDLDEVRRRVEEAFGPGALEQTKAWQRMRCLKICPRAKKVLELALREALRLGDPRVEPEHVLLGIVRVDDSLAARLLARRVPLGRVSRAVLELMRRSA
jgi:ATP-dependent Clp protease ATP-binding subunit ClpA